MIDSWGARRPDDAELSAGGFGGERKTRSWGDRIHPVARSTAAHGSEHGDDLPDGEARRISETGEDRLASGGVGEI